MDSLFDVLSSTWNIVLTVIGFSFIIFVHELGHFLMAKKSGVKVEKFYLGFDFGGWKVFSFVRDGTEYGIGVFPFGGYVKLFGVEELPGHESEPQEKSNEHFYSKTVAERFGIMAGGVAMNFIAAVLLIIIVYGIGRELRAPIVGGVGSYDTELAVDDLILSIDGAKVRKWGDIPQSIIMSDIENHDIEVLRKGKKLNLKVKSYMDADGLSRLGISQKIGNKIAMVYEKSPGEKAGVLKDDELISLEGIPFDSNMEFNNLIQKSVGKALALKINRNDKELILKLIPEEIPFVSKQYNTGLKSYRGKIGVTSIRKGSPAELGGLQKGDQIITAEGLEVHDLFDLRKILKETKGKELDVSVEREKKVLHLKITPQYNKDEGRYLMGFTLDQSPFLGEILDVEEGGPLGSIGLKKGDQILQVNGIYTDTVSMLLLAIERRNDPKVSIVYAPWISEGKWGEPITKSVVLRAPGKPDFLDGLSDKFSSLISGKRPIYDIYGLGVMINNKHYLRKPIEGSMAEKAGFLKGDELLSYQYSVNNKTKKLSVVDPLVSWVSINLAFGDMGVKHHLSNQEGLKKPFVLKDQKVDVKIKRNGKEMTLSIGATEDPKNNLGYSGLVFAPKTFFYRYQSFSDAVEIVTTEPWNIITMTVKSLKRLFFGELSTKALSGPVGIFKVAHIFSKLGVVELMWLVALLNINIGIMNLLPFPPLDGGALFFLLIEKIKGSPVSANFQIVVANVGVLLLVSLMVFVTIRDVTNLF